MSYFVQFFISSADPLAQQIRLFQTTEADLWPDGKGTAEEGSGDGAEAVEAEHIPPSARANSISNSRMLLSGPGRARTS